MKKNLSHKSAILFVILLGFVSLFADITYEGARSLIGQYMAVLGATGTIVGIVSGTGEFIGYSFRLIFGYLSDKSGRYWFFTILGYVINLIAVPLIGLAGNWPLAAVFIILERFGKAVRSPAKDAMLSYASKEVGRGWGFGLHEAMDQIGAILGPLIISTTLYFNKSYSFSFGILLIPALCALAVLFVAWFLYPNPQELEVSNSQISSKGFPKKYWLYLCAISLVALGYVDFPLMAYHFQKVGHIEEIWIPIFFSIAMAADGIASLIFGHLYDKKGISVLIYVIGIAAFFVPLVFLGYFTSIVIGIILWGIGLGTQESIMRAYIADIVATNKRGTAYGMLNLWFGVSWFIGSVLVGMLYDISIPILVLFSFFSQILALPLLVYVNKTHQ